MESLPRSLQDCFTGCLLGVALGDALGLPVEGKGHEECVAFVKAVDGEWS